VCILLEYFNRALYINVWASIIRIIHIYPNTFMISWEQRGPDSWQSTVYHQLYRKLGNTVEVRWSHMTTESHVFKASLWCSPSNKKRIGLRWQGTVSYFLFCGEGTWHCMCHFTYFFTVTHITNAKICSRYMTWRMTLLQILFGFAHHFLHCVQWNLTVIYRWLL